MLTRFIEQNNISDANAATLTSAGDADALHTHASLGSGDMLAATYDPTNQSADAFDMDNMAEGGINARILTQAERDAIVANSAKDTNVTTDLSTTQTATTVDVVSSDGLDATLPQAIAGGNAGVLSGADKTTLDATSGTNTGDEPNASTTVVGVSELATQTEVDAGTDATRAVTPASLATIQADVDASERTANKGANNGYAPLDGSAQVPLANLPASVQTGSEYKGAYNATTNIPTIINGTGANGDYYRVSVAGSQDFGAGSITFDIGDLVLYNGTTTIWEKVDGNPDLVVSVAGKQGVVTLNMDDLSETASNKILTAAERAEIAANTLKDTNVTTNLSTTQTATTVDVVSSDGTDATLPEAIAGGNAGVLSGSDKTKLNATSGTNTGDEPAASTTVVGVSELATVAEVDAGSDATRAVTPASLATMQNKLGAVGLLSGILTGLAVTVNGGDNTKFDVSAGTGIIIDWSTPSAPVFTPVTYSGATAITLTGIGDDVFTSLYINSSNALIQNTAGVQLTPQQRRQNVVIDAVVHADLATVTDIGVSGILAYQSSNAVNDYIRAIGAINSGNGYSANATNLTVAKAAGTTTFPWINKNNDAQNPSILTNGVQAPLNSAISNSIYRDGVGGFTIVPTFTAIDPDNRDDGSGTLVVVANNKFTIQRHYFFGQTNGTLITYGQVEYNSLIEARNAIFSEDPELSPLVSAGTFKSALVVKKGTTDLSNLADAEYFDILTQTSSAGAGAGAQDLQNTYDLSTTPEILTDSTRGALSIRRGSASDTDDVLEVENNAGTQVFAVDGEGNIVASGTVDGRDLAVDGTKLDGIESLADVTDTANVTAAGALMDSEVDADIKTLALPANTTITAFGAALVSDLNAAEGRATLSVEIGTDVQAWSAALDAVTGTNTGDEAAASTTVSGIQENATTAEVDTGTSTTRTITPDALTGSAPTIAATNLTSVPFEIGVAISDETTDLTTGTAKITFRAPFAMTLTDVRSNVNTAPTGSTLIVDINEGGVSVLSTKLSIDAGELTSTTAATPPVISDANIADDAEITIDIDQIGSTIAGKGGKVWLIGTRA